jgi:tetratricopeptide (TPR) repeat protein
MRIILFALAAALSAGAAHASSLVIGTGLARECYEAAELEKAGPMALGVCDRALTEEALSFDDQVATYVNRGIIRARLGDIAGAHSDYDRALRLDPDEPEAYLNKGALVLKAEQDWRRARELFGLALARQTRRPEIAHYARGVASELGGDLGAAYADYLKASELAPGWEEPKRELTRFSVRKKG